MAEWGSMRVGGTLPFALASCASCPRPWAAGWMDLRVCLAVRSHEGLQRVLHPYCAFCGLNAQFLLDMNGPHVRALHTTSASSGMAQVGRGGACLEAALAGMPKWQGGRGRGREAFMLSGARLETIAHCACIQSCFPSLPPRWISVRPMRPNISSWMPP